MQITPSMLKTALAPYQAASGQDLDVKAMKAAQGPVANVVQRVELAAPTDAGAGAAPEEQVFDNLIRFAKLHGGKIGNSSLADIEAGRHSARADRQYEMEHGFRKRNVATYEAAQAKGVSGTRLGSVQEATTFASDKLADIRDNLLAINIFGGGNATVGGTYEWLDDQTKLNDPVHAWMDARNQDRLEGSRMDLFVNAEYFRATFGIEESILETVGGKLQIRAFDIEYEGKSIARSVGDGTIAPYRADGTLELDRSL